MKRPRTTRAELRRLRRMLTDNPAAEQRAESPLPAASDPEPQAAVAVEASAAPVQQPARILTVCTGNICRSPLAEALLRSALCDVPVEVASAGTHALVGHSMSAPSLRIGVRLGADERQSAVHAARLLTEPMLAESDLVLAMSRGHRERILRTLPGALRRTFTVREFARRAQVVTDAEIRAAADAAGEAPSARIRAVALLISGRHDALPADALDDDVIDPYGRSDDVYEASVAQLEPALRTVTHVIRTALL